MANNPRVEFEPQRDMTMAFTTPIVNLVVHDSEALNEELKHLILTDEKARPSQTKSNVILTDEKARPSQTKSNVRGWRSKSDLAQWDEPAVKTLFELIDPVVRRLSEILTGEDPGAGGIGYEAWANVNRAGAYNKVHNHGESHWSGVYYVDAGEQDEKNPDSGKIEFQDPRGLINALRIPGTTFGRPISIRPDSGKALIFPSFLYHMVTPYTGAGERISISFNAYLRPALIVRRLTQRMSALSQLT